MITVTVTPLEGRRALLMHWTKHPQKPDIRAAYQTMTECLGRSETALRIVVDVSCHPHFPIRETVSGAFWGPFRNPALAEWLVVGASGTAYTIGRALIGLSGRDNIRWFDTMDEALGYLSAAEAVSGAPL